MTKRRAAREPYSGYKLPASADKGVAFIDFNKVVSSIYPDLGKQPVRKIKKRRKKI
tara:strand:+ start:7782 stop:7949 length:168 start_codon:yes stop_codon:yes gene_type:complete